MLRQLFAICAIALVSLSCVSRVNAQIGTFDDVIVKSVIPQVIFRPSNDSNEDWCVEVGASIFNVDSPNANNIFEIHDDANTQALIVDASNVFVNETLTLGTTGPRLEFNNGTDTWQFELSGSLLNLDGPNANNNIIQVNEDSLRNSLTVNPMGVAVGTDVQFNEGLLVFSDDSSSFSGAKLVIENAESTVTDREQIRLKNNGNVRLSLENTNIGTTWSLVSTDSDQFQIRKTGAGTANMAIRANGTFSFNFGGEANLAIQPSGDAFLRGTLNQASDRNIKKNFREINATEMLQKVVDLPITYWSYKKDADHIRHVGPMAQDFHQSFGVGVNETSISSVDTTGVALAAIQGLHRQLEARDKTIQQLSTELEQQTELVEDLQARLERLEALLSR